MKLVRAITGSIMLLGCSQAMAAPQMEYLVLDAFDTAAGIPATRKAWELRDSLKRSFNYRIAAHGQSGFRYRDERWMVHNLVTDAQGVSMLFDRHPWDGRFRFSAGVFLYQQSFDYVVAPEIDEVFEYELRIDPETIVDEMVSELQERGVDVSRKTLERYLPEDMSPRVITLREHIEFNADDLSAHARVKYKNVAPYFGAGFSNPFFSHSRLRYSFDLGFLYQVEPEIDLQLQGDVLEDVRPAVSTLLEQWTFEQKQKLDKQLEKYRFSPRLNFGLSYRF